jgi:predicted TIM-barrel fold metal-dependent hydrolase
VAELLAQAERRGLVVQLAVRMEDPRTHHPLLQLPDVDLAPLAELVAARPKLPLVLLNSCASLRGNARRELLARGNVYVEIATLEGVAGVSKLLEVVATDRVLFGSHFPFFNLESALLKMRESALPKDQAAAVTHDNAIRLLG